MAFFMKCKLKGDVTYKDCYRCYSDNWNNMKNKHKARQLCKQVNIAKDSK